MKPEDDKSMWRELLEGMVEGLTEPLKRKGELLVMICSICFGFLGGMIGHPFGQFWQITLMFVFALVGLFVGSCWFQKKE